LNRLRFVISQKVELFVATAVRASNLTDCIYIIKTVVNAV
jgi:hypothetical protein